MVDWDTQQILKEAREVLDREAHDRLVQAEVARLRGHRNLPFWRRWYDAIFPFTITIRRNK